jgi:hypothetical protein
MRPRAFFDDGLFFMSFSVALGIIAFIIPARGCTRDGFQIQTISRSVDRCHTGSISPDHVAGFHRGPRPRDEISPSRASQRRLFSACTGMSDTEQRFATRAAGSAFSSIRPAARHGLS